MLAHSATKERES